MRTLPFEEEAFREETGASALGGERGYSVLERLWTRPTCEVNGLLSGYTGEGAKTVLPAKAMAKVSCRLVPDQDPGEIERLMAEHVRRVAPAGVTATVTPLHGGRPWRAELDGPLYDAARRALAAAFGREPVITGEGGSIPVVGDFERVLGAPVLLVGFGPARRERPRAGRVDGGGEFREGDEGGGGLMGGACTTTPVASSEY
jgi:acetylornithine deacetylase/succinyl-diaminopimelate desuccinylase-like protein